MNGEAIFKIIGDACIERIVRAAHNIHAPLLFRYCGQLLRQIFSKEAIRIFAHDFANDGLV